MIKAFKQGRHGRKMVIIGLSGETITRLMSDEPILLDLGADLAPDLAGIDLLLVGGKSEAAITRDLIARKLLPAEIAQEAPEALREGGTREVRWSPTRRREHGTDPQ
jgi:hypothetical protein